MTYSIPFFKSLIKALALSFFWCTFLVKAQSPNYYNLNKVYDNFDIITTYDIIQAKDKHIWIGCDKGLYRYTGTEFRKYVNSDYQSEYSYIKEDKEGRIWCANFSGQLFYVNKNQQLTLFKDLSNNTADGIISFEVSHFPEIYVTTDAGYEILNFHNEKNNCHNNAANYLSSSKPITSKSEDHISRPYQLTFFKDDLTLLLKDQISTVKEDTLKTLYKYDSGDFIRSPYINHINNSLLSIYNKNNYAKINITKQNKDNTTYTLKNIPTINEAAVYFDKKLKQYWLGTVNGLYIFDQNFKLLYHYLENNNISAITKDHENNYWIGTLNKGIQIIPSLEIKTFKGDLFNKNIKDIKLVNENLYILTDDALLYSYNLKSKTLYFITKGASRVNKLIYNPFINGLHLGNTKSFYNITTNKLEFNQLTNLKHLEKISDSSCIISSSFCSYKKNFIAKSSSLIRKKRSFSAISINPDTYYIAHSDGLFKYTNNLPKPIKYIKKPLLINYAMIKSKSKPNGIWACDTNGKLYLIKDNKAKLIYDFNTIVNTIVENEFDLFIGTQKGIIKFNTKSKTISLINHTDGLPDNNVTGIEIFNQTLYASTNKGLATFKTSYNYTNTIDPYIRIRRILINNQVQEKKSFYNLNHNQNNINIRLNTYNLRSQRSYRFLYRLKGKDSIWHENRNNRIDYYALEPGLYNLEILVKNEDGKRSDQAQFISFKIDKPFTQKWWFYLLIVIGSSLWVGAFFSQIIKKKNTEKQLIYSSITSLKAQMNPHFLFNAINTIQSFILKSNKEKAYTYLTKLSFLIRENLNMSEKAFVGLNEEIELISTYLELEKIRFKNEFKYDLIVHDNTFPSDIKIPSMVIQPFIENAIKHGLMHKEGDKYLKIEFKQTSYLECIITDNGVGRKAAKIINANNVFHGHESFSTNAIKKRFDLLKEFYNLKLGFWYDDLKPHGTIVKINIPLET